MVISAVIPVYNGEAFVAEAIESVYAQTVPPAEVIVVDDGSSDATPTILRQFEGKAGFRSIRQANGGEASACNAGIAEATGEYIAFSHYDDLWQPEKIEHQLAQLDPDWGMSFTAYELRTRTNTELKLGDAWDPHPRVVLRLLEDGPVVGPPSTTLIRRDVLQAVGGFEDVSPFGTDWLIWLRIAAAGHQIGYVPESLTVYRWHGKNLSNDQRSYFDSACRVFDLYGDRCLRARWRVDAAIHAREHQDPRQARRRILEAVRIRPWAIRRGWVRLL